MNRSKLVWFAVGAATSACAMVLAQAMLPSTLQAAPLLIVEDHTEAPIGSDEDPETIKASGKALRDCGAAEFDMKLGAPDSPEFALLPITESNQYVFRCILNRGAEDSLKLDIWMTRSGHAQTH